MSTSVLKIGSRAVIKKKVRMDDSEFTTQIENIEDDYIRILTPLYKSILIRLHPKTRVELSVFSGAKLYQFDAEVIDTVSEGNLHYTDIRVTSPITKIERRNYFRVEVMQDILVRKQDEENSAEYSPALTVDLSGGGVQMSTTKIFLEKDIIDIKIEVEEEEIEIEGEILRRQRMEELKSYKYTVKFLNLDNFTKEMIIRYVFKIQRDKIQKEM